MNFTRIIALIMALGMVWTASSCSKDDDRNELPQKKEIEYMSKLEYELNPAGDNIGIEFIAYGNWSVSLKGSSTGRNWISVSRRSGGKGSNTVSITAQANKSELRECDIEIACGADTVGIHLTQKMLAYLDISDSEIELPSTGGQFRIGASAYMPIVIGIDQKAAEWLNLESWNQDNGKAIFSAGCNLTDATRNATVTFSAGDRRATLSITQPCFRIIEGNSLQIVEHSGGSIAINLGDLNNEYLTQDSSWVHYASQNGYQRQYTVDANTTGKERETTIEISSRLYDRKETLTIRQKGISDTRYKTITLQECGPGSQGIDIIMMGDGFIREDIESGLYENQMLAAYETLFDREPFKSFKDVFNVYYVEIESQQRINAVAKVDGAKSLDTNTPLGTTFTPFETLIEGKLSTIEQIARDAFPENGGERIGNATILVLPNFKTHAGTCHYMNSDYDKGDFGYGTSICFATGADSEDLKSIIRHEVCGHGFGKLDDEYSTQGNNQVSSVMLNIKTQDHGRGYFRNTDIYIDNNVRQFVGNSWPLTTADNVYWSDMFNTINNYEETEGLGIYKGASTFTQGFCRPTQNAEASIMHSNTGQFNAPSRRAIFYRIRCLTGANAGTFDSQAELQAFLDWDRGKTSPSISKSAKASAQVTHKPLPHPVFH